MGRAYGESLLALSYDPEEKARGVTALRSEWELLKKQLISPLKVGVVRKWSRILWRQRRTPREMSLEEVPHA